MKASQRSDELRALKLAVGVYALVLVLKLAVRWPAARLPQPYTL